MLALATFILWLASTDLLTGHYETNWGPGWLIGTAALASLAGILFTVIAMIQKPHWKWIPLMLSLILLSLLASFLAAAQLSEMDNALGDFVNDMLEQGYPKP